MIYMHNIRICVCVVYMYSYNPQLAKAYQPFLCLTMKAANLRAGLLHSGKKLWSGTCFTNIRQTDSNCPGRRESHNVICGLTKLPIPHL